MTHLPKKPRLAASGAHEAAPSPLGYEYRLSQPLALGEFGESSAMPLASLDAREMKALQQWQHSLLALRQAISGHR